MGSNDEVEALASAKASEALGSPDQSQSGRGQNSSKKRKLSEDEKLLRRYATRKFEEFKTVSGKKPGQY